MAMEKYEATGYEATENWREIRQLVIGGMVVAGGVLLAAWRLWDRTPAQLGWISLALVAFLLAALAWRHEMIGFSYQANVGSEPTFSATPLPVPRWVAAPALVLGGALLVLAGTSTGAGEVLASILDVAQTLHSAGENALGILTIPLGIIIMLIFAIVGVGALGAGVFAFVRFVSRGLRRSPDGEDSGLFLVFVGVVALGMPTLIVYVLITQQDLTVDLMLEPFRKIAEWMR
jgi:hypothetical protein